MHRSLIVSMAGHFLVLLTLVVLNIMTPAVKPVRMITTVRLMPPPSGPKLNPTGAAAAPTAPKNTPRPTPAARKTPAPTVQKPKATPIVKKAAPTPAPKNLEPVKDKKVVFSHEKVLKSTPTPTPTPTPKPTPDPEAQYIPGEGLKMAEPEKDKPPLPESPADSPPLPEAPAAGTSPNQQVTVVSNDATGGMSQTWLDQVTARVLENFTHPFTNAELSCKLSFAVLKDGTIQNPRLLKSSGSPSMDQFAFEALKKTDRLPPLYDTFDRPFAEIVVNFYFK